MTVRKAKPERWSRKGRCPSCDVGTGSKHRAGCTFKYGASGRKIAVKSDDSGKTTKVPINKPMTQDELKQKISALGAIDEKTRNEIICTFIGHSNIVHTFFGYVYCGRCDAQIGDALGSYYKNDDVVIQGHKCKACVANFKRATWVDKLYVKDPMAADPLFDEPDTRKTLLTL